MLEPLRDTNESFHARQRDQFQQLGLKSQPLGDPDRHSPSVVADHLFECTASRTHGDTILAWLHHGFASCGMVSRVRQSSRIALFVGIYAHMSRKGDPGRGMLKSSYLPSSSNGSGELGTGGSHLHVVVLSLGAQFLSCKRLRRFVASQAGGCRCRLPTVYSWWKHRGSDIE